MGTTTIAMYKFNCNICKILELCSIKLRYFKIFSVETHETDIISDRYLRQKTLWLPHTYTSKWSKDTVNFSCLQDFCYQTVKGRHSCKGQTHDTQKHVLDKHKLMSSLVLGGSWEKLLPWFLDFIFIIFHNDSFVISYAIRWIKKKTEANARKNLQIKTLALMAWL